MLSLVFGLCARRPFRSRGALAGVGFCVGGTWLCGRNVRWLDVCCMAQWLSCGAQCAYSRQKVELTSTHFMLPQVVARLTRPPLTTMTWCVLTSRPLCATTGT